MSVQGDCERTQAELLGLAVKGDARAARDLTALLAPRGFGQAYRLLGNRAEAEDVVQDALLRLWRLAPDWEEREGAHPSSWLASVIRNLCLDRMRRNRGVSLEDDAVADPVDPSRSAAAELLVKTRTQALYRSLARLPERQRQAVTLRHLENLGNPEIAEIMNISVEAVESLIARGKRALAGNLAGRRDELGFEDDET